MPHRAHISSGYGYGCLVEPTQVPGIGTGVQNSQKFPGRYKNVVPVPRVLWHGRSSISEAPGAGVRAIPGTQFTVLPRTGMGIAQNSQKFRVRVL